MEVAKFPFRASKTGTSAATKNQNGFLAPKTSLFKLPLPVKL